MISLKKIGIGLLASTLAVGVSMLGQLYVSTHATNTLPGNNEVITIADTTDGQPVNATISPISYSADGNIVLFSSSATNLPDHGGYYSLYIYNIKTALTARVDVSTNGTSANGNYFNASYAKPVLSETGRYVTFSSTATNLIDGVASTSRIIYKRDTQSMTTSLVGAGYTGGYSDKWDSNLAVSNDGRFVLASSRYLDNGYPYNYGTVIGEQVGGTYIWTRIGGGSGNSAAGTGTMSCDGMFAAYQSGSQINLVDLRGDNPITLTTGASNSVSPIISCNGRYVLYATSNRTQITPTPSGLNTYLHLVRYDRITGDRIYIDNNATGTFSTAQHTYYPQYYDIQSNIFSASIADTGDVVFNYKDSSGTYTYLKHLSDESGDLESVAKTATGTYANVSNGKITSDGRYIFFQTDPYNLGLAPSPSGIQLIRTKTNL